MAGAKEGVVFARNGIENTGFAYAFSLIEGKYKLPVLFCLYLDGTTRYNELKRKLAPATYKLLTSALRGLVADGLVKRVEYPQVPPKVEYSLTERGLSLMPVLDELCLGARPIAMTGFRRPTGRRRGRRNVNLSIA